MILIEKIKIMKENNPDKRFVKGGYMIKKLSLMMLTILSGFFIISNADAGNVTCASTGTCDEATFASVAPDALIVLDLSANMNLNPAGGTKKWGYSTSCVADTTHCIGANCADGFCANSTDNASCTTDCSRLAMAKRSIFDILDDDNNGVINSQDSNSLGIRFGFLRFRDGENSSNDITPNYNAGQILLIKPIAATYQSIYCGATASGSCATTATTCADGGECIANEYASGGASVARALNESLLYLNDHKAADSAGSCRQKFAILITTSSDDCYGVGSGNGNDQCVGECDNTGGSYNRRQQTVLYAKALNDAGYTLYVVGFGQSMPDYLRNTLNWIASWGGTDNPMDINSGDPSSYNPANLPSWSDSNPRIDGICGGSTVVNWYAPLNDPGYIPLSGYAFIAGSGSDLSSALKEAVSAIREQTYSFTRVSVQTVRTVDENYIYEASFQPLTTAAGTANDPFWLGHLKRYSLNADGSLHDSADWDAGEILKARTGSTRTIYTYKGGSLIAFNTTNITIADLGAGTTTVRDDIVNFIYNGDQAYNSATTDGAAKYGWKLGDIFHSSPISIGTPSVYFSDKVDLSSPSAYDTYRAANQRTSALGNRLIVAGANDGQFHVFKTGSSGSGGGSELWSFIPPNMLPRLKSFYHNLTTLGGTHPPKTISATHEYFVDGPSTASDIWTGTGDGTAKSSSQWKAYMIISEGRGGIKNLWSSSQYCDSNFSDTYSSTYNRYCGYYAFDVTNTLSAPDFKWHFGGTAGLSATQGPYLGQPWAKITMGRVKISGNEKWVGFAAGGYAGTDCKTGNASNCDKKGKGFFVIDLLTGNVLWTYSYGTNSNMAYSLAGQPASVDLDDDGFIDTVYSADLGGNVWRFKFCTKTDSSSCDTTNWTGGLFFATASGNLRPIYTKPTVVHALSGDVWVYFGSGDVNDPTASNAQEKMYAIKDNSPRTATYHIGDLTNITSTSNTYDPTSTSNGWYMNLSGSGQKILADPTVYADVVYFTSYNPGNSNNVCATGGEASLSAVDYITGAGMYSGGARSTSAGTGIASGAVVSENPYGGTNIYVTTSEGARINPVQPPDPFANKPNLQYWHDMRVK
jgi:hypothetical protein